MLTTREHLITLPFWGPMSVFQNISDLAMFKCFMSSDFGFGYFDCSTLCRFDLHFFSI